MSNKLQETLDAIKLEKDTNLLPENIKKDVKIFDIVGTLEEGAPTNIPVKLFETEQAMQADTTAKEGDLAVVYRSEVQNIKNGDVITSMTFPKTVVFDTAITTDYYSRLRNSTEPYIYLHMQLSSTSFHISDMPGTIPGITYTSSDGITYTRTDSNEDTYEIGETTIRSVDEHICKFIQVDENVFEGLYTYKPQHKTFKVAFPNFSTSTINITNKKFIINDTIITSYNKNIFKNAIGSNYCTYFIDTNNKLKCIVAKRTLNELAYDSSGNCVGICTSNVTSSSNYFTSAIMYDVDSTGELTNPVEYTCYTFDTTYNIVAMNYTDFKSIPVSGSILASQGNASSGIFRASMSAIWSNSISTLVKADEYYLAPTQLTTTSDYVYEKEFYGKNGVETGTLTQGVSNSFTDLNAEIYSKIQNAYNSMEPRILTDTDKTIEDNILFVPAKLDGTPLLDTSNMTNMNDLFAYHQKLIYVSSLDTSNVTSMIAMFERCTNLTEIPLLDTSKVTTMTSMFQDCSKLTEIPLLDTSKVTSMSSMFQNCTNLTTIPLLNTSSVANIASMFHGCTNLTEIPSLDTSSVTNMNIMFQDCSKLTTIPLLNTSKVTGMINTFQNCTSLSDESLNNILAMCKNATSYSDTKTLAYIGLTSNQANRCKTLSNYSAFTAAGWTTGY